MITRLKEASGHFLKAGEKEVDADDHLERDVMMVYTGKFASMDGDVHIKDEDIDTLVTNHNSMLAKVTRMATGEVPLKTYPPLQLDHSKSSRDTIGRVIGEVRTGEHELSDGQKVKALYGRVRVMGKENVAPVKDGRWSGVSIGADLKKHTLSELSITNFPAAAEASLLAKGDDHMGYKEMKEKMAAYAKCKKHLMDQKKMSEEDADKHLESAKDEELKHMAEEADEHEKKMAKKLAEDKEKEGKDKEAKMAQAKADLVKLVSDFRSEVSGVQMKAKESHIHVRLSRLRSEGKVTPAEIKKLDITKMAAGTQAEIDAALKSYDEREPVIHAGQMGSLKAMDPSQIASDFKKLSKTSLEKESIANMPFLQANLAARKDPRVTQLASPAEEHMASEPGYSAGHDNPDHDRHLEKEYETLSSLMDEGKHDEAKELWKKMRGRMKKLASPAEEHMASEAEHHMSALADQVKLMQTKLEKITELVALG